MFTTLRLIRWFNFGWHYYEFELEISINFQPLFGSPYSKNLVLFGLARKHDTCYKQKYSAVCSKRLPYIIPLKSEVMYKHLTNLFTRTGSNDLTQAFSDALLIAPSDIQYSGEPIFTTHVLCEVVRMHEESQSRSAQSQLITRTSENLTVLENCTNPGTFPSIIPL